ncbi:coagulation factor 5/8 type domain-containing protein [Amycolatopsis jejuensis]|uniref:coagulation factor 5/8 type domain-containing protein n=1 Tax=Amycolatopsis jejuensis TaxID=330084 RepID=UPI003CCBAB6B
MLVASAGYHPMAQAGVASGRAGSGSGTHDEPCVDSLAVEGADKLVRPYTCRGTNAHSRDFRLTREGDTRQATRFDSLRAPKVTSSSPGHRGSAPSQLPLSGLDQRQRASSTASVAFPSPRHDGEMCPDAPITQGGRPQQYACHGTAARSFTLTPVGGTTPPPPGQPDLGPNVVVFDPSMPGASIQSRLDGIFAGQEKNQFGSQRYALLFKPGTYSNDVNVGFYTQVLGLGSTPDAVTINGAVHVEADWFPPHNATQNFWRGAENLSVNPVGGTDRWAVSQASPYRRMHVRGDLQLDDGGWSSGGWIADSKIDGQVRSGSQQQWISRDSQFGGWSGSNWNMVFVGVHGAPAGTFPNPPYTTVDQAPVVREKPYLHVDESGDYRVFVPALRTNTSGVTWDHGDAPGTSLPIERFFIVKPGATAADMNTALAAGKNLLITPGVYHLDQTLHVTRPDTVVLGLGIATLVPDGGITAMTVDDVDGVKIAGLLLDAGTTSSATLMQVGTPGSDADHSANPTSLHDVFFRVGGAVAGKARTSLVVNSNDVIGDHMWIWRADHAADDSFVGWDANTADTGLVVNGDDVTTYGLFVEHFQRTQVVWNGNGGRTYFFQNEMPYDVPDQASWMDGTAEGYSAYQVAPGVTSHEAWGLGSYCFFDINPSVASAHAFEAPVTPHVRFHDMVTVSLNDRGTITHVINDSGETTPPGTKPVNLVRYP